MIAVLARFGVEALVFSLFFYAWGELSAFVVWGLLVSGAGGMVE